ncbi:hypothetical protein [Tabrizicola fusiformis]|uniref:hypothetical protein n=1 Tax=Tabrizicola sp. SY72 TaxID=2741673 RepID=UPI0015744F06|nr:hypothetical protein [Tabrizicola sp. SY72]NTT84425.1 hypothetical protein [Tabrizicola sp. SY72]
MSLFSLLFEVLFVGHSLIGPTLPELVEAALDRHQPTVVEVQLINGASLAFNWDHSVEAEGVDARARLANRPADVLILTEAQPVSDPRGHAGSAEAAARFATLAAKTNPEVRVFLYETWPARGEGADWLAGWTAAIAADLPAWEGIAEMASAHGVPVAVIPAGQGMARLAAAMQAGQVPGLPDPAALLSDDIHPSGKALYFLAMVQVATITGQSPEGLPARLTRAWPSRDAAITAEQAQAMQRIAWEVVSAYRPAGAPVPAAAGPETPENQPAVAEVPAAAPAPLATFPPVTNPNLALGLSSVTDWSVQQPFLDLMKTARPWVGHLPGQWGGWEHDQLAEGGYLDAEGWPKALPPEVTGLSTLILTDLPPEAAGVAGRYVLTWEGDGALRVEGRAAVVSATPGRILFDYTPGEGTVLLTIGRTAPADPIRHIRVVREDRAALLESGAIFNPDWLARIRGVKMLRFMDWGMTNDSRLVTAADRPRPSDYTWARIGVPVEVMVALTNELDADAWFAVPHLADDTLVRDMAGVAKGLEPGRRAWVEYSNEVWNWQFAQARWAEEQGRARWGQDQTWVQFYALRASEVAAIWAEVFADPARLVRVISVQTGWLGLEEAILNAPLVMAEGRPAPVDSFDAYAVTGYFSAMLGSEGKAPVVRDWLAQSRAADSAVPYALANRLAAQELRDGSVTGDPTDTLATLLTETLPYHAAVAADHGLKLVMYEGGSHVVGYGPVMEDAELTDFFVQLNAAPEMGALYETLLAGWSAMTDAPFNSFGDVYRPGKWGSWGALRHLGDDTPRWRVLSRGCAAC